MPLYNLSPRSCEQGNKNLCAQATSMSSDEITEEAVYLCTGNPLPQDIEQVAHWLLNEPFAGAFESERSPAASRLKSCVHPVSPIC